MYALFIAVRSLQKIDYSQVWVVDLIIIGKQQLFIKPSTKIAFHIVSWVLYYLTL